MELKSRRLRKCHTQEPGEDSLRIMIDGDVLRRSRGGIWRVTSQLESNLRAVRSAWRVSNVPSRASIERSNESDCQTSNGSGSFPSRIMTLLKSLYGYTVWPQFLLPLNALFSKPDWMICPNYVFPLVRAKRCVVIIHDTSNLVKQGRFHLEDVFIPRVSRLVIERWYGDVIAWYVHQAVKRAAAVVVPTFRVKHLLESLCSVKCPIYVVEWGVDPSWLDNGELTRVAKSGVDVVTESKECVRNMVLCVNAHSAGNVAVIANAVDRFNERWAAEGLQLYVCTVGHIEDIDRLPSNVNHVGHVEESTLRQLYSDALVVGVAKPDSGFGLPVLEALASGCPCIVKSDTAEAEVASGHGVLLADSDIGSWLRALEQVAVDPDFRMELSLQGLEWAQKFTWIRTAEKLASIIESLELEDGAVGLLNV